MKTFCILSLAACLLFSATSTAAHAAARGGEIRNGAIWPDADGVHINAHGGGMLYHKGRYYWYGEHKNDSTNNAMVGVMCYSSKNLTDWRNEGAVLRVVTDDPASDITQGCIIERPKSFTTPAPASS